MALFEVYPRVCFYPDSKNVLVSQKYGSWCIPRPRMYRRFPKDFLYSIGSFKKSRKLKSRRAQSIGKKAQSTVEYIILLCVILVISITIIKAIVDWMHNLNQLDLQKAEAQSYRNGLYKAGGFKELAQGNAVKFHPRANPNEFHIFKRTETEN